MRHTCQLFEILMGGDLRAQNFNGILNTFIYSLYANKLLKMTYFNLLIWCNNQIFEIVNNKEVMLINFA